MIRYSSTKGTKQEAQDVMDEFYKLFPAGKAELVHVDEGNEWVVVMERDEKIREQVIGGGNYAQERSGSEDH